jgi:hypothetical protein
MLSTYMDRDASHLGLCLVGGVAGGRLAGRAGDLSPLHSFSLPGLGLAAAPKKLASVFCPAAGAASPLLLRFGAMMPEFSVNNRMTTSLLSYCKYLRCAQTAAPIIAKSWHGSKWSGKPHA